MYILHNFYCVFNFIVFLALYFFNSELVTVVLSPLRCYDFTNVLREEKGQNPLHQFSRSKFVTSWWRPPRDKSAT